MNQTTHLPAPGAVLSFQKWETSVIELLVKQPKGCALKVGQHGAILLILGELIYLETGDDVRDGGSCDSSAWDEENAVSCTQALYARELFQRCTPQQVEAHELEAVSYTHLTLPTILLV